MTSYYGDILQHLKKCHCLKDCEFAEEFHIMVEQLVNIYIYNIIASIPDLDHRTFLKCKIKSIG